MKRQKKSSATAVVGDNEWSSKWSDHLPEDIIHRILLGLPNTKEAATKSLISKSWLRAWNSSPFLVFNDRFCNNDQLLRQQFYEFVDRTMSRIKQHRIPIHTFVLHSNILHMPTVMDPHLPANFAKWVNIAINNKVQDMSLSIYHTRSYKRLTHKIAENVLNNRFLKSLSLNGCVTTTAVSTIHLPSLQSLTLSNFEISDIMLKNFLKGCPHIETLSISLSRLNQGRNLSRINLTGPGNFDHLKTVKVELGFCGYSPSKYKQLVYITIDAPNLENFCLRNNSMKRNLLRIDNCLKLKCLDLGAYSTLDAEWFTIDAPNLENFCLRNSMNRNLSIDNCLKLKCLDLEAYSTLDGKWFYELIGKLTCLETLRLKFTRVDQMIDNGIKISSPYIKKIELIQHLSKSSCTAGITVDAPRLSSFRFREDYYSSYNSMKSDFLVVNPSRTCRAHLMFTSYRCRLNWLIQLREIIGLSFRKLRSLSLFYYLQESPEVLESEEDVLPWPSSTMEIEFLYVEIRGLLQLTEYEKILSWLLSVFHPEIVTVAINGTRNNSEREVLKLLRKIMLENNRGKGEISGCRCSDDFKCWKHQLNQVVKSVDEDKPYIKEWGEVDRNRIYREKYKMCFKLKWL